MLSKVIYVILGFFLFFIPGYLLSYLFYPDSKDLDSWNRLGVSIGLGALVIALIVVILAQPALRALKAIPFLASIALFCISCMIILIYMHEGISGLTRLFKRTKTHESSE
ncbi:MAG: DUF1616 domain-containing protein [Hadesarchaea archaeon]|nr:DUF1616 domain-containing protein [Hadesarchaea archaeon]